MYFYTIITKTGESILRHSAGIHNVSSFGLGSFVPVNSAATVLRISKNWKVSDDGHINHDTMRP